MKDLLRRLVAKAPHKNTRFAAVVALAEYFGGDPQRRDLLRQRACEEPEEHPRRKAVSVLSRIIDVPHAAVLASQDLDGAIPGWDPWEPISAEVVSKAAKKLGISEKVVEDLYRQLGKELSLTLAVD